VSVRHGGLVGFSQRAFWPLASFTLVVVLLRLSPLPLKRVFIVLFTAVLLAAAVAPAARYMARFRVPRGVTILVIYLLVLAALVGVVALIVPLVVSEVDALTSAVPDYVSNAQKELARIAPDQASSFSTSSVTSNLTGYLSRVTGILSDIVLKIFAISIDVILILVIAFFLAVEEDFASTIVRRFAPPAQRPVVARILGRIGTRLGQWARAQMLLALFFGVAFGIGLRVMGLNYAVTLGVIGGVLEIIPYVGGFITVALAALIALTQHPILIIPMAIWYGVVVELEGHVLAPKLMEEALGIHPLVVVVALFIGGEGLGILGALLAVPIAIVFQVLIEEFYVFSGSEAPKQLSGDGKRG
jgi:predicted PurR-regulated permease PerM